MVLMILAQNDRETILAAFSGIDEGRQLARLIPGYHYESAEESEDGFEREWLVKEKLPVYCELLYKDYLVPFTGFAFPDQDDIDIYWRELANLDDGGFGLMDGVTLVDAYSIPNEELSLYISSREEGVRKVSGLLEAKGYETERAFAGSEDGEAILYRKVGEAEWHFLSHLDPIAIREWQETEQLEKWLDEAME